MGKRRSSTGAGRIALVGVLTALSVMFLYLAALTPTGQLGVVAAAGLMPAAAVVSAGLPAGAFCYAATGILGLLLSPDKGGAALYLVFFGLYPLIKCLIERLRKLPLEWLCKLAFFNLALTLCWFFLRAALLEGLPPVFEALWVLYLIGNAVFVAYDLGFSRLIALYTVRIDKNLRRH
jgi:hypothetical protein